MCTVSFVTTSSGIVITSNRDEHVLRAAIPPQKYIYNNKSIIYPKDPAAGGTWYATDGIDTVLVLLNGAAEKHAHLPPYRRSRGLIVLDLISAKNIISDWNLIDLNEIEPFTIVLYSQEKLYQLQWNGSQKSKLNLSTAENHIWSSSTLYTADIRQQRAEWFATFVEKNSSLTPEKMFQFHRYTENSDSKNGLVISRNDVLKTISITQTILNNNGIEMRYHDLLVEKDFVFTVHDTYHNIYNRKI